mmetsp:Transcript_98345/g.281350  ORF Transcript_98345/g.281350 Transcript_98345/m.281350 type:complete len:580 (-) Transcript_98345:242-1981(-)
MAATTPGGVSFSACGWLKLYEFGVAKALQEARVHEHGVQVLGASAGALCAVGLILDLNFDKIAEFALQKVEETHGKIRPAFRLRQYVSDCFEEQMAQVCFEGPGGGLEQLKDRVGVAVTTLPLLRNRRYTMFKSKEHVKQVLLASCTMTPLAGFPYVLDGALVFDGGLTDFQPQLKGTDTAPAHTITISPFYCSSADIRPSRYIPLWWALYPPRKEDFAWIYHLGYDDARSYLARNHYTSPSPSLKGVAAAPVPMAPDLSRFPSDFSTQALRRRTRSKSHGGRGDRDPSPTVAAAVSPSVAQPEPLDVGVAHQHPHHMATGPNGSPPVTPVHAAHPTHSYADLWPYERSGAFSLSEHSFARVFGYRSVLNVIPSSFLDLLLLVLVFCLVRPLCFFLVYVELAVRMAVLTVTTTALTALEVPLATAQTLVISGRDAAAGMVVAVLPAPIRVLAMRLARVINYWLAEAAQHVGTNTGPSSTCSSINGQPVYLDEAATVSVSAAAAAAALAAAEKATPWTRMVLNFRERIYHARDLLSTILSPTLLLRMVPLLGQKMTGDAHRFRRKLCEKSAIYRVCVHFL